jgi:hypothetical protein
MGKRHIKSQEKEYASDDDEFYDRTEKVTAAGS